MPIEVEAGGLKLEAGVAEWRGWITLLGIGLLGAAIGEELSKPAEERTWQGLVFGVIPYDLRPPSIQRIRERLWDPSNPQVLVPTAFGVGWSLNFAALARRLGLSAANQTG